MAPATLKRSVITVFMSALSCIDSRVRPCSLRPTPLAASTKNGSTASVISVSCQLSASISPTAATTCTTFAASVPNVPVKADCAPITSLLRRLISAPVCVRVKNASGMRWTWSKRRRRRSKIRCSPTHDET